MSRKHKRRHGFRPAPAAAPTFAVEANDLPMVEPTFRLDHQIAEARRDMGEARWAQLNAEWL